MGFVVNDAAEVRRLIIVLADDVGVPSGYISPQLHLMVLLYARYDHICLLVLLLLITDTALRAWLPRVTVANLALDEHSGFASALRLALVNFHGGVRLSLLLSLGVIDDVSYIDLCVLLLDQPL